MVRVSYDYDLMTVLARHLWHLRDELDVTSQSDKTFAAGDVGPRRETAEALEDFYGAWKGSFKEGWRVMTDLGNLLDRAGKAFYDQDASHAAGAAQQVTSQVRSEATRQNKIREQTLAGRRRQEMARNLEARHNSQQARLKKEQDALLEKQKKIDERNAAQQKRQEALNKEQEELARKREPLVKQQDELQAKQRQLWQEEKELLQRREEKLQAKRDELQKEYEALSKEQEPLIKRQEELQGKQRQLWEDEKALRAEQDAALRKEVTALEQEQKAYEGKQDVLQEKGEALWKERQTLLDKGAPQSELDAWQRKQDALDKERDALWESEGKGLAQRWDALEQEQRDGEKAFAPLRERQRELDDERDALSRAQEPLSERQDGLQAKQKDLWDLEKSTQKEVQDAMGEKQKGLDAERSDLQERMNPLDEESNALQTRQKELWDDQAETDEAQAALAEEEKPFEQRQQDIQDNFGEQYDKVRDWNPETDDDLGQLWRMRGQLDDLPDETFVPNGYTVEDANSTTTVSYKLDENGEIKVDKNGDPVETTTTVTNKNTGLSYSETYRQVADNGDSATTIRSSDGTVTKVFTQVDPPGWTKGYMQRFVTDETGRDTLQIWSKAPGGEWVLNMDKETYLKSEAGQADSDPRLSRPPAYFTAENPLVDADGHPTGSSSKGTTTQLQHNISRTNYTESDGSVLKVVTVGNASTRYIADETNEIQEIWFRRPEGTWYLAESATQREGSGPSLGTLDESWS